MVRSGDHAEKYTEIRDERAQARALERRALNAGESLTTTVGGWSPVLEQARSMTALDVADIEVIAWRMEAEIRLSGFAGLAETCRLAVQLIQPEWPNVYSADTSSPEASMEPFSGLNGVGSEGSLIQPIRLSPLLPGYPFGAMGVWQWQRAERDATNADAVAFNEAIAAVSGDALRAHVAAIVDCRRSFSQMTTALERICGAAAPSSTFTTTALEEVEQAAMRIYTQATGLEFVVEDVKAITGTDLSPRREPTFEGVIPFHPKQSEPRPVPAEAPPAKKEIQTREDAFAELLKIASFFRRTEPHSPISYSIETIVRRGRMPLPDLLTELVPDPDLRNRILTTAGIQTPENTNV